MDDILSPILGFNGERTDPVLGSYHLGNGYRMYNPTLRRFTAPDSMSPFGKGGINPYAYCGGDPINNTDPTGHFGLLSTIVNTGLFAADLLTDGMASTAVIGDEILGRETAKEVDQNLAVRAANKVKKTGVENNAQSISNPIENTKYKIFRPEKNALKGGRGDVMTMKELIDHTGGYSSNFAGTGEEGIILHGQKTGKLAFVTQHGNETYGDPVSTVFRLDREYKLNIRRNTDSPLHILACYLSDEEVGRDLSANLGRPVYLYGNGDKIRTNAEMLLSGLNPGIWNVREDEMGQHFIGEAKPRKYIWVDEDDE
ncbi:RHS repeat-associated core domain-containing protein [Serratia marcescens]|uniref:RHS repeat-associated core domain-containing protein n=1 Tax=Serratia marcescens TaxID=615 RepID=UPI001EF10594|nr:RHS repeat-associated core domain-containing protein [Serratia marcescens]ULH10613.1 RHS repeat-associated core domain-containing protein [Serratia marcescens]